MENVMETDDTDTEWPEETEEKLEVPPPRKKVKAKKSEGTEEAGTEQETAPKKRRGRPPGSKNKAAKPKAEKTETPKKRGRPPGAKKAEEAKPKTTSNSGLVQALDLVTRISQLSNSEYLLGVLNRFAAVLAE